MSLVGEVFSARRRATWFSTMNCPSLEKNGWSCAEFDLATETPLITTENVSVASCSIRHCTCAAGRFTN